MPSRRLPRYDAERDAALRTGKDRKDALPPPVIIPYTAGTITRLDTLQPVYRTKYLAVSTAKNAQTAVSAIVDSTHEMGIYLISDFIDALNRAIRRKLFLPTDRNFYQLAVDDDTLPVLNTETQLITWGLNLKDGEAARIAAGGAPITFPSIADVNTAIDAFKAANQAQANAKEAYGAAQQALDVENTEADKLILKMWNETETAFDEGNKPNMRSKCREWGVIYVPAKGETLNPSDFSITGGITDTQTGAAVSGVSVKVIETGEVFLSDGSGIYFVSALAPGTYSLLLQKAGYPDTIVSGVAVTSGAVTTRNISFGGVITIEATVGIGVTFGYDASGLNPSPTSGVIAEVSGNNIDISAAPTLAGGPGPVQWNIMIGTIAKPISEFATLTGADDTNHFFHFHNAGPTPAHFKLTINNLLP